MLEASIGVVKTFDVLPAGETAFDQEILLGSPRNLNFTIKGYDPTGANRELARCVLPVAYGMASEETSPATLAPEGTNIDLFGNIGSVITKILIVLGVLMVLSFAVLVALTMMERARAPFDVDDDEDDDLFDAGYGYAARGGPGRREDERGGGMRDEEINYTKRMLAIKDKETDARPTRREPIPLPPAETPVPRPQVFVEYEEPAPFMPERRPAAKAEPSRQTARTQGAFQAPPPAPLTAEPAAWRPEAVPPAPQPPYGAAASGHAAQYRPAGGKPLNVEPAMRSGETVRITPKVFDYRKQPAPQSMRRGDVVRVERRGAPEADDGQE